MKHRRTPFDLILEALALGGLVAGGGLILASWNNLPDTIPTHFDLTGSPNSWGASWWLFVLSGAGVASFVLLIFLTRIAHYFEFPWSAMGEVARNQQRYAIRLLQTLNILLQWLLASIAWISVRAATAPGYSVPGWLFPLFLFLIFTAIGCYLDVARPHRPGPDGRR